MTLGTGLPAVHAQMPPPAPLPPVVKLPILNPQAEVPKADAPKPDDKGGELRPKPMPMPNPTPPMPSEQIAPPTHQLFPSGCATCGDVNPNCADPGCAGGMPVGPKDPVWMNNGIMILWFQPMRGAFPLAVSGAAGQPTRTLLNGQDELGRYFAPKIDGGLWLNKDHTVGAGIDGFITEHRSAFATFTGGPGGLSIQRPFIDATTGTAASLLVASGLPAGAGGVDGSIATTTTARLASLGGHLRRNIVANCDFQLDLMYGIRYYDLDESLTVYQRTALPAAVTLPAFGAVAAGATAELRDRSYTRNQFYGGELGARLEYQYSCFTLGVTPKVAFGQVHQITQINGDTKINGTTVPGGLLAAGVAPNGNIGRFITNRFAVATDVGAELGVNINKNTRVALGYQFYYLNTVARPGQQLDQAINTRVVPLSTSFNSLTGPRAPNVTFDREGFYAHGVSLLLQARY